VLALALTVGHVKSLAQRTVVPLSESSVAHRMPVLVLLDASVAGTERLGSGRLRKMLPGGVDIERAIFGAGPCPPAHRQDSVVAPLGGQVPDAM
jgi:hypothetical protein